MFFYDFLKTSKNLIEKSIQLEIPNLTVGWSLIVFKFDQTINLFFLQNMPFLYYFPKLSYKLRLKRTSQNLKFSILGLKVPSKNIQKVCIYTPKTLFIVQMTFFFISNKFSCFKIVQKIMELKLFKISSSQPFGGLFPANELQFWPPQLYYSSINFKLKTLTIF